MKGKKKLLLQEAMPSPQGRRIAPIISEDLKKKIKTAIKTKENKGKKGVKKEVITDAVSTYCRIYYYKLLTLMLRKWKFLAHCIVF